MWTPRSDATNSADNVARLLDLRKVGVPGKSHDCGGVAAHSLVLVDMGGMFARCRAGFCRALGSASASAAEVGGGAGQREREGCFAMDA